MQTPPLLRSIIKMALTNRIQNLFTRLLLEDDLQCLEQLSSLQLLVRFFTGF